MPAHSKGDLQMNTNHDGSCQRELGPAAEHHRLAAWALRSLRTSPTRGNPRSCISRGWTGGSVTLMAGGHNTKGLSKHRGQVSYTCAHVCTSVLPHADIQHTHELLYRSYICTQAYAPQHTCRCVHRHMSTHISIHRHRSPHTHTCAPADRDMHADKNAHLYIA